VSEIQTAEIFRIDPNWEKHKNTFEDYKVNHVQPDFYGRDARLDHPHVHHIHLAHTDELESKWAKIRIDKVYYRTAELNKPEDDFWLIYAYDEIDDKYLLLTILGPDAHNKRPYLRALYMNFVVPWIEGRLKGVI